MSSESGDPDELQAQAAHWRRLAYLQFFRLSALIGALLSATIIQIVALIPILALELVLTDGLMIKIRGVPVPLLRVAEVVIAVSVLWEGLKLKMKEEPEFHRIET